MNFALSPVPHSPYQLSAMWSAPSVVKYGNITAYTVYCNTSATQAYPEQVIGPNIPTIRSVTAANSYGEGAGSLIAAGWTDESSECVCNFVARDKQLIHP